MISNQRFSQTEIFDELSAEPKLANKNEFDISFDNDTKILTFTINKNGDYTMNHVDVV